MMSYCHKSKENARNLGEVFTPAGCVFTMLLNKNFVDIFRDYDKTMLDPATGEGQFPCAELVLKMFFNIDRLDENVALHALNSLYGVDIQESSCDTARKHLIATLGDAYKFFTGKDFTRWIEAARIVHQRIMNKNFFEYFEEITGEPAFDYKNKNNRRVNPNSRFIKRDVQQSLF